MSQRSMDIEQALATIRSYGVFLHYDPDPKRSIQLWTPGVKVPITLRRAIVKHRAQLQALMDSGDVRVCPARDLHRKDWRYVGNGTYVCETCERLEDSMIAQNEDRSA